MKTSIAIIGATGNMGSALTRSLAGGPFRLLLIGSDGEKLEALRESVVADLPSADLECTGCPVDASWEADVIIPAVPYPAEKSVAEKIRNVATQKVVVSLSNPLNESKDGLLTPAGTSAGEELQALLPDSKVVKAFNTTYAAGFTQPVTDGQRVDCFVAGNDAEAVNTVTGLVEAAGFHPVVAGKLSASRTLEAMQLLLVQLSLKNNHNRFAGFKILFNREK